MQKYRGVLNILLLFLIVVGAAFASVALEDSAPTVAAIIRRLTVVGGAAIVLSMWSEWRDSRARKKQAVEVKDDVA